MTGQPGFFDGAERLQALSAAGDPLERLAAVIDFEGFYLLEKFARWPGCASCVPAICRSQLGDLTKNACRAARWLWPALVAKMVADHSSAAPVHPPERVA